MIPKIAAVTHCSAGEGKYLLEWAAWLTLLGVGRLFIFEHNNERDEAFIAAAGILTSLEIAEFLPSTETKRTANIQIDDMLAAADLCSAASIEWLLSIDLDEFPVINRHDNLAHLLDSLPASVSQILINWKLYGSNGAKDYDGTRTHFEKFTRHAPLNHHAHRIGKTCLRVADIRAMKLHLHEVSGITVDGDLEALEPAAHPHGGVRPAFGIGWLAHFSVRSRAEFEEKAVRGYPDDWHGKFPGEAYWRRRDLNEIEGPDLSSLGALISARLSNWKAGGSEISPAITSIETGRLRKINPEILPKVPQSVALWRIKSVLEVQGKLASIDSIVASLPADEPATIAIRNGWKGNATLKRNDPATLALASMANLTSDQIDDIFVGAANLFTGIMAPGQAID